MMKVFLFGSWLSFQGYLDFKYKEIPNWVSLLGGIIGIVFCIIEKRSVTDVLLACVPGMVLLLFSWITKEVIGYGDGIILIVMGIYLSASQVFLIGMLAFGLAGIVALILLVIFHKRGTEQIPFIPFLVVAYGLECLTKIGGRL